MYLDPTFIVIIPALIFTIIAQAKVKSAYKRYSRLNTVQNCTGAEAARRMLNQNGLQDVSIDIVKGTLTDHYNPRKRSISLSQDVYNGTSIASVSIAAHEAGHAVQHAKKYVPLKVRGVLNPIASFGSKAAWILLIAGFFIAVAVSYDLGYMLVFFGIIGYALAVVFQAVTLPVEFNASKRALAAIVDYGIVQGDEEWAAKRMLSAAALTYVAALATSVATLLRLLLIVARSRR